MTRTFVDVEHELDGLDEKLEIIRTEARNLVAAIGDGMATPGQTEAIDRYRAGTEKALHERAQLRSERNALQEEYIRRLAQNPNNVEEITIDGPRASNVDVRTVSRSQAETVALRAVERFNMGPKAQDRLDRIIRDVEHDPLGLDARYLAAVANPDYLSAFGHVLASPGTAHLRMTPRESEAVRVVQGVDSQRAMSLTGAAGGLAVPFDLDPTIIATSNGVVNPIRKLARIVTTSVDTWRGVSSGAITASYEAEATETTDNSPTLAQPEISTERAQAFIPFSIEIGQDWPSMQRDLLALLQDAKDQLEASKFLAGSGTNEPFGVLTGTTNTINAATGADAFSVANVYALVEALPPRYQPNAAFLASAPILNRVYRLTPSGSTTEPQLMNPDRASILGKPVYEASNMPTSAGTGNKFLVYGDFSRFVIVDRIGLSIELIPHLMGANRRPTGQRGLYAFWRNSSRVVDANAFRALVGTA